jgi:hypothetical protein
MHEKYLVDVDIHNQNIVMNQLDTSLKVDRICLSTFINHCKENGWNYNVPKHNLSKPTRLYIADQIIVYVNKLEQLMFCPNSTIKFYVFTDETWMWR